MRRDTRFFGQEAAVAYQNEGNADGANSSGIYMWMALRLQYFICDFGHTRSGNAQWVKFNRVPRQDVALLNVYALHTLAKRSALGVELLKTLP